MYYVSEYMHDRTYIENTRVAKITLGVRKKNEHDNTRMVIY